MPFAVNICYSTRGACCQVQLHDGCGGTVQAFTRDNGNRLIRRGPINLFIFGILSLILFLLSFIPSNNKLYYRCNGHYCNCGDRMCVFLLGLVCTILFITQAIVNINGRRYSTAKMETGNYDIDELSMDTDRDINMNINDTNQLPTGLHTSQIASQIADSAEEFPLFNTPLPLIDDYNFSTTSRDDSYSSLLTPSNGSVSSLLTPNSDDSFNERVNHLANYYSLTDTDDGSITENTSDTGSESDTDYIYID